jgi:hypothetical protein
MTENNWTEIRQNVDSKKYHILENGIKINCWEMLSGTLHVDTNTQCARVCGSAQICKRHQLLDKSDTNAPDLMAKSDVSWLKMLVGWLNYAGRAVA